MTNKERAFKIWEDNFGQANEAYDYASHKIVKDDYQKEDSEYSWDIDLLKPIFSGGLNIDANYIPCSTLTMAIRNQKNAFKIGNFTYEIRKGRISGTGLIYDVTDKNNPVLVNPNEKSLDASYNEDRLTSSLTKNEKKEDKKKFVLPEINFLTTTQFLKKEEPTSEKKEETIVNEEAKEEAIALASEEVCKEETPAIEEPKVVIEEEKKDSDNPFSLNDEANEMDSNLSSNKKKDDLAFKVDVLETEKEALLKEIDEGKKKIEQLNSLYLESKAQNEKNSSSSKDYDDKIASLNRDLEEANKKIADINSLYLESKEKNDQTTSILTSYEEKIASLSKDNEEANKKLNELNSLYSESKSKNDQTSSTLSNYEDKLTALNKEKEEANKKIIELNNSSLESKNRIEELTKSNQEYLDKITSLVSEKEENEKKIEELNTKVNDLSSDSQSKLLQANKDNEEYISRIENLNKEKDELTYNYDKTKYELEEVTNKYNALVKEQEKYTTLLKEQSDEIQNLKTEFESLQSEQQSLQEEDKEASDSKDKEIDELKKKLEFFNTEYLKVKENSEAIETEKQNLLKEKDENTKTINDLKDQNTKLLLKEEELGKANNDIISLNKEKEDLLNRIKILEDEKTSLLLKDDELNKTKEELTLVSKEKDNLTKEKEDLLLKNSDLEKKAELLVTKESDLAKQNEENSSLTKINIELNDKIKNLEEENSSLKLKAEELEKKKEENQTLLTSNDELKKKVEELNKVEEENKNLKDNNASLINEKENKEAYITTLTSELAKSKEEITSSNSLNEENNKKKQEEIDNLNTSLTSLKEENEKLKETNQTSIKEKDELSASLNQKEEEIASLNNKVTELTYKLTNKDVDEEIQYVAKEDSEVDDTKEEIKSPSTYVLDKEKEQKAKALFEDIYDDDEGNDFANRIILLDDYANAYSEYGWDYILIDENKPFSKENVLIANLKSLEQFSRTEKFKTNGHIYHLGFKENGEYEILSDDLIANIYDFKEVEEKAKEASSKMIPLVYLYIRLVGVTTSFVDKNSEELFFTIISKTVKDVTGECYIKTLSTTVGNMDSIIILFDGTKEEVYQIVKEYAILVNSYRKEFRSKGLLDAIVVLDQTNIKESLINTSFKEITIYSKDDDLRTIKYEFNTNLVVNSTIKRTLHIGPNIFDKISLNKEKIKDSAIGNGTYREIYNFKKKYYEYPIVCDLNVKDGE